ncbi:MAG: O-antigen ligase family protein [Pseudomonadota bacterium]
MQKNGEAGADGVLQGAIGWTALWAALLSALMLGANRPVSWILLGMVVLALFAAQTALDLFSRRPPARGTERLWLPALLYVGVVLWGLLQTIPGWAPGGWIHPVWAGLEALPGQDGAPTVSADPDPGRHHVIRLATDGALFWIMIQAGAEAKRARAMIRAVAVFSGLLAAYGLAAWSAGSNPILGEEYTRDVVQASFVNRNSYATYAAFGALANLAALAMSTGRDAAAGEEAEDPRRSLRDMLEGFFEGGWIFALGALLCFSAVVLTQSRAGAAAALAGVGVFLAAYRRKRDREGAALIGAAVVVLGFVTLALSSGLAGRLLTAKSESLRFVVYPEIWDQALERPWLGHGLGAFHEVFRARVPFEAAFGEWDLAHSSYLENLFELGAPAAAAFYVALGLVAWRLLRGVLTRRRNRLPACLALGITATAALHSLMDFSLQMPAAAALYAALAGIGWAQSFPRRRAKTSEKPSISLD